MALFMASYHACLKRPPIETMPPKMQCDPLRRRTLPITVFHLSHRDRLRAEFVGFWFPAP